MSKKENKSIKRAFTAIIINYEKKWEDKDNYRTFWEAESII